MRWMMKGWMRERERPLVRSGGDEGLKGDYEGGKRLEGR